MPGSSTRRRKIHTATVLRLLLHAREDERHEGGRQELQPYRAGWRQHAWEAGWYAAGARLDRTDLTVDRVLSRQALACFQRGSNDRLAFDALG